MNRNKETGQETNEIVQVGNDRNDGEWRAFQFWKCSEGKDKNSLFPTLINMVK